MLLIAGFLMLTGCHDDHPTASLSAREFTAELAWRNAGDLDLFVVDPKGDVWNFYKSTSNIVFVGDNQCGFGPTCDPAACGAYLPCDTHESVRVSSAKLGRYTLWVSSWTASTESIALYVTFPREQVGVGDVYHVTFECLIPANTDQAIADLVFSEEWQSIAGIPEDQGFAPCQIIDQGVRSE